MDQLPTPTNQLHSINITTEEVHLAISSLDNSKAYGCDNIGPHLIKLCAPTLLPFLTNLYHQCISSSSIPNEWKIHKITPILKTVPPTKVSNYRPISVLCTLSLILEAIIHQKVIQFVRPLLTSQQFGFLSNRSCLLQLLLSYSTIYNLLDSRGCLDAIYLDFTKAFDTVPHGELLFKLWKIGITGPLWLWFKDYLTNRLQFVQVRQASSSYLPVISGVPQGSVLGPLLFLIYINDLPQAVSHSTIYLFADDTKFFLDVSQSNTIDLQHDLNAVTEWCKTWKISLNLNKCSYMRYSSISTPSITSPYVIEHQPIPEQQTIRDLGITITSNLSFHDHYKNICSKAYGSLNLIRRTFHMQSTSIVTKRNLYVTLVRSKLTYCSQLWRPRLLKDIIMLETVQKRSTKFILHDYTSDYKSRLIQLNLLPLMYWYDLQDLLFLIKCMKNPPDNFSLVPEFISFTSTNTRSGHHCRLQYHYRRTSPARHFYFNRVVKLWNTLPPINIALSYTSIKRFIIDILWKRFLLNFDSTNACTYQVICPCCHCYTTAP